MRFFLCSFSLIVVFLLPAIKCKKEKTEGVRLPHCLRVEGVQSTAAIIYWRAQPVSSTSRHSHIILCNGLHAVKGSKTPSADFMTRFVPAEVHQLTLTHLKPNANYSCTVETERVGVGHPCRFTTNSQRVISSAINQKPSPKKFFQFRKKFRHMATTIMFGGVLPMLLLGGCAGTIYLLSRYRSFKQKNKHLKQYRRVPTLGPTDGYPDSPGSPRPRLSPYNNPQSSPTSPYPNQPSPQSYLQTSPHNSMPPSPYKTPPPPPVSSHRYNTPLSLSHTPPVVPPYYQNMEHTPPHTSTPLVPPSPTNDLAGTDQGITTAEVYSQPTNKQTSMLSFSTTDYEEVYTSDAMIAERASHGSEADTQLPPHISPPIPPIPPPPPPPPPPIH